MNWWHWFQRRERIEYVSLEWLQAHDRQEITRGIDGVCWRFPINKIQNESVLRNANHDKAWKRA